VILGARCIRSPILIRVRRTALLDGTRVLVDRLWPRGLSKKKAHIDEWMKEVAPSDELRGFFSHEVERWEEFRKKYFKELEARQDAVQKLIEYAEKGRLTLLFAAKDTAHNNAVALREYLTGAQR
jgi:uncharacterized protein YeaO (DUF488 family)